MVDFSNYEEARRWFAAQPREVSVAMAARAALRVLPLLGQTRGRMFSCYGDAVGCRQIPNPRRRA